MVGPVMDLPLRGVRNGYSVNFRPPLMFPIVQYRHRFPEGLRDRLDRLIEISGDLRQDREKAFYGDVDFIPTDEYTQEHGGRARDGGRCAVAAADELIRE